MRLGVARGCDGVGTAGPGPSVPLMVRSWMNSGRFGDLLGRSWRALPTLATLPTFVTLLILPAPRPL